MTHHLHYPVKTSKLPFIDALRGLAVFGVWLVHTGQLIENLPPQLKEFSDSGARGVQLFFVISAFTLLLSWESRKKTERHVIPDFFIRRFFRIAPLFYTAIVLYTWLLPKQDSIFEPLKVLMTATFTNGLIPNWSQGVVPGGWSVAAEMLFYLIFPCLTYFVKGFKSSIYLTVVTFLISVATYLFVSKYYPVYYWFPTQLPIFSLGFMLFFMIKRISKEFALETCSILMVISILFYHTRYNDFAYGCFFVVLAFVLYLYPLRLLVNPFWCYLGAISFSGYLSHFALLNIAEKATKMFPISPILQFILALLIVSIGSILVSSLTFRYIELPGINLGRRLIARMEIQK